MINVKHYIFWIYIVILIKLYQAITLELLSRRYTSVPYHEIRVGVTYLNLGSNLITMLDRDAFKNCSSLVTLNISYNEISMIHDSAFNGLPGLKHL